MSPSWAKTNGRGLLEYAAAHDYNPCITRTFGIRYACRHAGCGFIPKSEADWFIATQFGHTREYWFCAACGGEFKYGLNKAGQDNDYQHVIFMSIPWHDGGYRTMCARAVEPTNEQKAMILALKGITAAASLTMPVGVFWDGWMGWLDGWIKKKHPPGIEPRKNGKK